MTDERITDQQAREECQQLVRVTLGSAFATARNFGLGEDAVAGMLLASLVAGMARTQGAEHVAAMLDDLAGTIRAHDPQAPAAPIAPQLVN